MAGPGCPAHKRTVGTVCEQCLPVLLKGSWHAWPDSCVAVQSTFAFLKSFRKGRMKSVGFGSETSRPFLLLRTGGMSMYFYLHFDVEFHVFIWLSVFVPLPGCLWQYLVISSPLASMRGFLRGWWPPPPSPPVPKIWGWGGGEDLGNSCIWWRELIPGVLSISCVAVPPGFLPPAPALLG